MNFKTGKIADDYIQAPDGSEIRLLHQLNGGGLSECTLQINQISEAVIHKTVEEIWLVTQGQGEIWLKESQEEKIISISEGYTLTIPLGTGFQFRNTGREKLKIIISTMPPWPGNDEALKICGRW